MSAINNLSWVLVPGAFLGPVALAIVLYLMLRLVLKAPGGRMSAISISQHALWIGVIGWLASSLAGASTLGILEPSAGTSLASWPGMAQAVVWPVIAMVGVHAVGQFSYPQPSGRRRTAGLSVRSIRDFLPRGLAAVTGVSLVASAATIGWVAFLPGFPASYPSDGAELAQRIGPGRIEGADVALWLGVAWILLAAGTVGVLWLIARRRHLEALDATDNDILRTIAMNRLLRTVTTVAWGLAGIVGTFATTQDPMVSATGSVNILALINGVVLLWMWLWAPPTLAAAGGTSGSSGKSRSAPDFTAQPAAQVVAAIGTASPFLGIVAGVLGLLTVTGSTTGPARLLGVAGMIAATAVLTIIAGELLLQRNHGGPPQSRATQVRWVHPAVKWTTIAVGLLYAAVLTVSAVGESLLAASTGPIRTLAWPVSGGVVTGTLVLAALGVVLVLRRRRTSPDVDGLDTALRSISLHRILRITCALLVFQTGLLLAMLSPVWPLVLGLEDPAVLGVARDAPWQPAVVVGTILWIAALVLTAFPVSSFARSPKNTDVKADARL